MGDKKQIKLMIRGGSSTEIENVLRHEFKEYVNSKHIRNLDGSTMMVDVGGSMDVEKLYERLKKMTCRCSIKIESVVPDDLHTKMDRDQQDLQRIRGEREEARSELSKAREKLLSVKKDKDDLHTKMDRDQQDLQRIRGEREEARSELSKAREKLLNVKKDKDDLHTKMDKDQQDLQRIRGEREEARSELSKAREKLLSVKKDKERTEEAKKRLEAENNKLKQKIKQHEQKGGNAALRVVEREVHREVHEVVQLRAYKQVLKHDGKGKEIVRGH
ncbi:hypothetical protein ABZP36_009371 [Zizania latifolia]